MRTSGNLAAVKSFLGIWWLSESPTINTPHLTSMDSFEGQSIVLYPEREDGYIKIHADVDESKPFSIVSQPVLHYLQLDCQPCQSFNVQDKKGQVHSSTGKIGLKWHKESVAKPYSETFYVINADARMVMLGGSAFPGGKKEENAGVYPLGLAAQTSEEKAKQAQKKAEEDKKRAEQKQQQEANDRAKLHNQGPST
ncbi:MAG: hypothetical protein Q9222_006460 [Ikaeria aurantiellina]